MRQDISYFLVAVHERTKANLLNTSTYGNQSAFDLTNMFQIKWTNLWCQLIQGWMGFFLQFCCLKIRTNSNFQSVKIIWSDKRRNTSTIKACQSFMDSIILIRMKLNTTLLGWSFNEISSILSIKEENISYNKT